MAKGGAGLSKSRAHGEGARNLQTALTLFEKKTDSRVALRQSCSNCIAGRFDVPLE